MQHSPMLGMVEMRLSDDDIRSIATMVAAEIVQRQALTDDALQPLSRGKTASLFGVDVGTLVQWERSGRLVPFFREGRVIRYSRQQIAAFLAGGDR